MKIPFSPPFVDNDVINEVQDSLKSGWITTGPKVMELERMVAQFSQVPYALGVNSATSGLMLALHWFGITKGDEVIIPAYTYAATALAIMHIGAVPVMVDSGDNFNLDTSKISEKITSRTKAIIPVDIGGWPCDYQSILQLVNSPDILSKFQPEGEQQEKLGRVLILSDAAHSIGATYFNRPAASWGDITVFSLHAVKNITSAEGGMVLINLPFPFENSLVYATMRLWSLNGQTKDAFSKTQGNSWRYDIVYPGFKMNLPDVLASIALAQLRRYADYLLPERGRIFKRYEEGFSDWFCGQSPMGKSQDVESSYHLYALRIKGINEEKRDEIIELLANFGIGVNVHFQPLPNLTLFKKMGYDIQDFPKALDSYSREISLPIYPQLTNDKVDLIINKVKDFTKMILE